MTFELFLMLLKAFVPFLGGIFALTYWLLKKLVMDPLTEIKADVAALRQELRDLHDRLLTEEVKASALAKRLTKVEDNK